MPPSEARRGRKGACRINKYDNQGDDQTRDQTAVQPRLRNWNVNKYQNILHFVVEVRL